MKQINSLPHIKTDILVIGAGIAGLEAACAACEEGLSVVVISKGATASDGVLGFNAVVSQEDSVDLFYSDTRNGGWNISNPSLAKILSKNSVAAVKRMRERGLEFDTKQDNSDYHLLKPLGCSVERLVHSENLTGRRTIFLLKEMLIKYGAVIKENNAALSLIKKNSSVVGAVGIDLLSGECARYESKAVVLSTGGVNISEGSTYPASMTADGYAMAYEVGATLIDMEFNQYEPCRAVYPNPLGISTTLLAKGGMLKNTLGERFVLSEYKSEGEAPKDVLARLIAKEIMEGRGTKHKGVYLDLTGIPEDEIKVNHTLYYKRFINEGIDLTKDIVEVGPAAHSFMGGVKIDEYCRTGVPGLFAAGEVTGGVHGANRIGGSAGTEIFVFGAIAGEQAALYAKELKEKNESSTDIENHKLLKITPEAIGDTDKIKSIKSKIRNIMSQSLGPIREKNTLISALEDLQDLREILDKTQACDCKQLLSCTEASHMLIIAIIACSAALAREESRGTHYRMDFPDINNEKWSQNICFSKEDGMTFNNIEAESIL